MGGKTGRAAKAGAKDWWGVKLLGQPTQFIFGYGSLINSASRHSSAGKTIPAIPVRISAAFGYIRTWNDRSASGFTALGLRKSGPDEKASTINGVLYAVRRSKTRPVLRTHALPGSHYISRHVVACLPQAFRVPSAGWVHRSRSVTVLQNGHILTKSQQ
jgi:hypothetical protein